MEFAQNSEGDYRSRSIYANGGSGTEVSLSAAVAKSIIFRDSIYVGSGAMVELNANYNYTDYTPIEEPDSELCTIEQKGDILFTGSAAEADLHTMTDLYGGRLRVEDGAVYQSQGIIAHEGSEATVRVKDATLSQAGYALTFNAGTKLETEGNSTISGNVVLKDGAAMSVNGTVALDGGLSLKFGASAAALEGGSLVESNIAGDGGNAQAKDVWMETVGEAYEFSGVAMENVHFSAALATLTDVRPFSVSELNRSRKAQLSSVCFPRPAARRAGEIAFFRRKSGRKILLP